jgi:hypothetical protein
LGSSSSIQQQENKPRIGNWDEDWIFIIWRLTLCFLSEREQKDNNFFRKMVCCNNTIVLFEWNDQQKVFFSKWRRDAQWDSCALNKIALLCSPSWLSAYSHLPFFLQVPVFLISTFIIIQGISIITIVMEWKKLGPCTVFLYTKPYSFCLIVNSGHIIDQIAFKTRLLTQSSSFLGKYYYFVLRWNDITFEHFRSCRIDSTVMKKTMYILMFIDYLVAVIMFSY